MLSRIFLNLLICSLTLCTGQIHLIHIKLYTHRMLRLMEFGQKTYRLDCCFIFQGKFFYFLAINRHREVEYNLLYPASVFSLFREHLNSLNKGFHKLFLFCFRCGMVDFIKCQ